VTRLAFGEFVLDSDTRRLLRAGRAVPLSPKAFQLLEALVASRPRALSKDELHDLLWPDSFVVEANLANLVGSIRAALGDDAQSPRYVRTVHRFGYAFEAEAADAVPTRPRSGPGGPFRLTWKGGRAVLAQGEHVLGREPGLEISLDSTTVSRRQALIRVEGDEAAIEDLGSKNGTYVGGKKIRGAATMKDRDVVKVGPATLTLRVLKRTGSTRSTIKERPAR
jgi:DNA-binding winged helix-turn-helix (wHTH) protein